MGTTDQALIWIEAAEQCHQTDLRLACTSRLVQRLLGADPSGGIAASIVDVRQLGKLDYSKRQLVLALVLAAARQLAPSSQRLAYSPPSDADIAAAIQQANKTSDCELRTPEFLQLAALLRPGQVEPAARLKVPGGEWRLLVYPNGSAEEHKGHLSGELWCYAMSNCACMPRVCPANSLHPQMQTTAWGCSVCLLLFGMANGTRLPCHSICVRRFYAPPRVAQQEWQA